MFVESLSVTDKEFGTDPKWMPFKRDAHGAVLIPHETDPGGIPLFGVDGCLDPAGIKEAELRIASLGVPTKEQLSSSDEDEPQFEAQPAESADGRQRKRPPFDAPQIAAKVTAHSHTHAYSHTQVAYVCR
jgi:hypothetical protein|tara:strand:- start:878 stop:1267 length:390 start_codon:yes stop_codon:yes gene_type:complete